MHNTRQEGRIHLLYESTGKEGGELEASEVGLSSQCGLNQAPRQRGGMEGELQGEETAADMNRLATTKPLYHPCWTTKGSCTTLLNMLTVTLQ